MRLGVLHIDIDLENTSRIDRMINIWVSRRLFSGRARRLLKPLACAITAVRKWNR
jgi:hypothetical protein